MAKIFFSYSHADEVLRDQLEKHLSLLKRSKAVEVWHDRRIAAGTPLDGAIDAHLDDADIVLLLVSADFLDSEYCYTREMERAMERHRQKQARVIPVILRHCDWKSAPFGTCLALPKDGRPVVDWPDRDAALLNVVEGIKAALPAAAPVIATAPTREPTPAALHAAVAAPPQPRSSNLRVRRVFSDAEKYRFATDGFDYMLRFFAGSVAELNRRHADLDGTVTAEAPGRFHAVLFRNGRAAAECHIRLRAEARGDRSEITFAWGADSGVNSYNESLSIGADDQALFFCPLGMSMHTGIDRDAKLSFEGAAEYFWGLFIEPLQQ